MGGNPETGPARVARAAGVTTAVSEKKDQVLSLKATKPPVEVFRLDYKEPVFSAKSVYLEFDIRPRDTRVTSVVQYMRRKGVPACNLELAGEEMILKSVHINGSEVHASSTKGTMSHSYGINEKDELVLPKELLPQNAEEIFEVKVVVEIDPSSNSDLTGLYKTGDLYCTQCEPHGFRKMTYFLDRPDVMSLFRVKVIADKKECPVLLSNGNKLEHGDMPEGDGSRHYAVFEDPHKKPSYLFALVAGQLSNIHDTFTTKSGKKVDLYVHSEARYSKKLHFALDSLKRAMKWDEEKFGREYDLDVFHIVGCNDFNVGAMENKGLNIFNTVTLLADPATTTDREFDYVLGVVAHEYFHNWTGNRVTCRDWFQLTLKEGLTVFRDELFTEDQLTKSVNRIERVMSLKARQFPEDSSPMAHPTRPDSYISMDNFYTSTVYVKGAEVVRMYRTILGEEGFRRGMDLYFERYDGQAVTCDDFRTAMADAGKRDFTQFERWYLQAGTPVVTVEEATWHKDSKTFVLTVSQATPPTPRQPEKLPQHIPILMGLVGKTSKKDLLTPNTTLLELTKDRQTFEIPNVPEDCLASIMRNFSAPVKLKYRKNLSNTDLAFLMAHDSDEVNKWTFAQEMLTNMLLERAKALANISWLRTRDEKVKKIKSLPPLAPEIVDAFKELLLSDTNKSIVAYTLVPPDLQFLQLELPDCDPIAIHVADRSFKIELKRKLSVVFQEKYDELAKFQDGAIFSTSRESSVVEARKLANTLLAYLCADRDLGAFEIAERHFHASQNMTTKVAAAGIINSYFDSTVANTQRAETSCTCIFPNDTDQGNCESDPSFTKDKMAEHVQRRDSIMHKFYQEAKEDPLLMNKYLGCYALAAREDSVEELERIIKSDKFDIKNPNNVRAVFSAFGSNSVAFHKADSSGYNFIGNHIPAIDRVNAMSGASLCNMLVRYKNLDAPRREMLVSILKKLKDTPGLSNNAIEIITKGLQY